MPNAIRIIRDQQQSCGFGAFLQVAHLAQRPAVRRPPDFRWLRTLDDYVERFFVRLHQPNQTPTCSASFCATGPTWRARS
jgi:hypothetical protein